MNREAGNNIKHTYYRNLRKREHDYITIMGAEDNSSTVYEYDIDGAHNFGFILNTPFAEIDNFVNLRYQDVPTNWKEICIALNTFARDSQEKRVNT